MIKMSYVIPQYEEKERKSYMMTWHVIPRHANFVYPCHNFVIKNYVV